jgi:hypothetical protein
MFATPQLEQGRSAAVRRSQPSEDLSKRFGGLVVVEYLMDLFGESPKELFSRIDVLVVLDRVKNDSSLFPEAVVAMLPSKSPAEQFRDRFRREVAALNH